MDHVASCAEERHCGSKGCGQGVAVTPRGARDGRSAGLSADGTYASHSEPCRIVYSWRTMSTACADVGLPVVKPLSKPVLSVTKRMELPLGLVLVACSTPRNAADHSHSC